MNKKNKIKKITIIILLLLVCLTGCTKQLTDSDGKRIMNEETGQSLTGNILCLPEDEKLLTLYKENYDDKKERCLKFLGYKIYRFTNEQVDNGEFYKEVDKICQK